MADDSSKTLTIDDVMKEEDDFRLAIRGFALIEDAVADGISEAFEGTMPAELVGFRSGFA